MSMMGDSEADIKRLRARRLAASRARAARDGGFGDSPLLISDGEASDILARALTIDSPTPELGVAPVQPANEPQNRDTESGSWRDSGSSTVVSFAAEKAMRDSRRKQAW